MRDSPDSKDAKRKQGSPLAYFLVLVSCIFIGILLFAYAVTKRAHPVYVDEHGKAVNSDDAGRHNDAGSGSK